jgi:outer membrane protein OmpA-like peptidoglycan-associated protein
MKKINLFLVLMIGILSVVLMAQKEAEAQRFEIKTAYLYQEASLLISDTDLNCSYFIRKGMSESLRITGAEHMDWDKQDYSDGDRMYINKGSNDGIKEGDTFLVFSKGQKVDNGLTAKHLGTYYLKESQADVTCIYEDKAVITLRKGCNPVHIGDFLVPFKPQEQLIKQKPIYTRCRLPQNRIEGNVVYVSMYMDSVRVIAGPHEYVTIDLGKAIVAQGDFLLFYKLYSEKLPPLIVGTGIVIDSQNTNSTVKVLDSAEPVRVGTKLVVLQKEDLGVGGKSRARLRRLTGEENIPVIDRLEKEEGIESPAGTGSEEQTLEVNILFDINQAALKETDKAELAKIAEFIQGKSEFVLILRGYTCSIGNEEYNLKLSKERVDNVKQYMMDTFNIKPEFFETYHYGEKEAPFDNTSEEERRKNRLVSVQVIGR